MGKENAIEISGGNTWLAKKKTEWRTIIQGNDTNEIQRYFASILDQASSLDNNKDIEECLAQLEFCSKQLAGTSIHFENVYGLMALGMDAYFKGNYPIAEIAFRILSDNNNINGINNYAYMMRRGEVSDPSTHSPLEALRLLRTGVKEYEPFAFVNMALTFALCFGTNKDWHIADDLMENLPETNTLRIQSWWADVAKKSDIEGVLVHYFLLRHGKLENSELGNVESMSKKLASEIDSFPDWLIAASHFQHPEDVNNDQE